jgi:hypothetical protein
MMHKKGALDADHTALNAMEKISQANNDSSVYSVIEHLSGKQATIVWRVGSTGLNYGLPRAAQSDCYPICPATANPSLKTLKTIGFAKRQKNISIYPKSAT